MTIRRWGSICQRRHERSARFSIVSLSKIRVGLLALLPRIAPEPDRSVDRGGGADEDKDEPQGRRGEEGSVDNAVPVREIRPGVMRDDVEHHDPEEREDESEKRIMTLSLHQLINGSAQE